MSNGIDTIKWWPKVEVLKWSPETVAAITARLGREPSYDELVSITGGPDEVAHSEGNGLTNAGLNAITGLLLGLGGQAFTGTTQAAIGVGDSATAFNATQTALVGTAWYQVVSGAPSRTVGAMTASAIFGTGDANFVWNEWCWVTASSAVTSGATLASISAGTEVMWNRSATTSLGTKASGAVWTLQTTITIA